MQQQRRQQQAASLPGPAASASCTGRTHRRHSLHLQKTEVEIPKAGLVQSSAGSASWPSCGRHAVLTRGHAAPPLTQAVHSDAPVLTNVYGRHGECSFRLPLPLANLSVHVQLRCSLGTAAGLLSDTFGRRNSPCMYSSVGNGGCVHHTRRPERRPLLGEQNRSWRSTGAASTLL